MKIRFVTFSLAKYGGIIQHIETKYKALKDLGHDVDIIILDYKEKLNLQGYFSKVEKLESGEFQDKLEIKSQNGGYSKSSITNYWCNPYYGWLLEPYKNIFPCLDKSSINLFKEQVKDCDLIIWSFVPTKTSEAKGFNWWHEYFELPSNITQVLTIHDGYYDLRNSWTNLLKNKISFFECVHITSYNACKVFDFPILLNYDSREVKKIKFKKKSEKSLDFFAAHIFKSMKRMEDLISAIPYLEKDSSTFIAGSGIELYYMMTEDESKQKPKYTVSKKTDPDCDKKDIGKSLFSRAEEYGMEYLGLIDNENVEYLLKNSKFAIDPSFCTHYAKYVNTHLNGFIIEAMVNGCYPILRNYRKDIVENDYIFKNIKAIFIPYDSTPKEFAEYLNKAKNMPESQYLSDIKHNYDLSKKILNPRDKVSKIVELSTNKKLINKLEKGKSNKKINDKAKEIMKDFFKYEDLPDWMN